MGSLDASASTRRLGPLAVVAAVAFAAVSGFSVQSLLHRSRSAAERSERSSAVLATALTLDGLEWRAIAGEPIGTLRAQFEEVAESLTPSSDTGFGSQGPDLGAAGREYVSAVRAELDALEAGDVDAARTIDRERVDPAFDAVKDLAEDMVSAERARAADASRTTAQLAWGMASLVAVVASVGIVALLRHRERRVVEQQADVAAKRFRALVESSADVVTVVSGEGEVAVMSPTVAFLSSIARTPNVRHISDLLPPERLREWSEFDDLVRSGQTIDGFETQLLRHDGSPADVELIGRPLPGEPGQRVWVWRDISQRKTLEAELTRLAFRDSLTGIANRALLLDRIDHAVHRAERSTDHVSILLCDLDGFKAVNDALGHDRGDDLLKALASRIAGCLRAGDTLARLGGDEFAVLLVGTDGDTAMQLADRILDVVGRQLELADREIFPTMSIGVASFEHGITTRELIRRADVAMYDAKRAGKARAALYRDDLGHDMRDALHLHGELRRAVTEGSLALVYQPTVSLTDGSVSSVEALVRWTHPTLGPIPPTTFIPLAEESGVIVALGKWVLAEACRAATTLHGTSGDAMTVHVNISPHQLNDPELVRFVKQTLHDTGLDPHLLVLEVTEGALVTNDSAIDRLLELHGLGIRLAIDDFGAGYASITYLRRLPVDILKIDRAFVSGDALPRDERHAFLKTIIDMAHNLHLTAVAEGVETDDQRREVTQLGCDRGQGYLWSRPVDVITLRDSVRATSNPTWGHSIT